jgi:hypothetical protein
MMGQWGKTRTASRARRGLWPVAGTALRCALVALLAVSVPPATLAKLSAGSPFRFVEERSETSESGGQDGENKDAKVPSSHRNLSPAHGRCRLERPRTLAAIGVVHSHEGPRSAARTTGSFQRLGERSPVMRC